MTLAESLVGALHDAGVRLGFGIPGDFALDLFRAVDATGRLPVHTLSHEPGVGFAADAAARVAGAPVMAAVTYGAGALNMVNAVACAYAEMSPVVVVSGAPGTAEGRRGLLLHHQVKALDSQLRIYQEITCDQAVLDDPVRAPGEIARVLVSLREHSRPVYIEVPRDLVDAPCAPVGPGEPTPVDPDAVAACADEVLERIAAARRPLLMVGVEVRRRGIEERVARLARRLGLPVSTDFLGRGLLHGAGVPLIGTYLGPAGDPGVAEAVETSDALLLLGVILSDTNFGVSERRIDARGVVHAMDREVRMGHHVYPGVPVDLLVDALLQRARGTHAPPPAPSAPAPPVPAPPPAAPSPSPHRPLVPDDIATAIGALFDRHGPMPMSVDVGDSLFAALGIPGEALVAPAYYATMGFGVPGALGVQAATGRRPLALVGDGAFQMTGWELGNAARHGWDPVVVVLNNSGWEMLRAFQPSGAHDLGTWRYTELAEALGARGRQVRTPAELAGALEAAWAETGRVQVIEALVPPGTVSSALARFVAAVGSGFR